MTGPNIPPVIGGTEAGEITKNERFLRKTLAINDKDSFCDFLALVEIRCIRSQSKRRVTDHQDRDDHSQYPEHPFSECPPGRRLIVVADKIQWHIAPPAYAGIGKVHKATCRTFKAG